MSKNRSTTVLSLTFLAICNYLAVAKPTLDGNPAKGQVEIRVAVESGPIELESAVILNSAIQVCLRQAIVGGRPLPTTRLNGRISNEGLLQRLRARGGGTELNHCLEKALAGTSAGAPGPGVFRVSIGRGDGLAPGKGFMLSPEQVKKME